MLCFSFSFSIWGCKAEDLISIWNFLYAYLTSAHIPEWVLKFYHDEFWYLFLNLFPHSMLQSLVQTLWCRARSTESTSDCSCPCQHPRDRVGFHSAGSRSLTAFSKESAVSCNGLLVLSVVGTSRIQVLLQLPSSFSDTIWLTWKRCLCCKIRKKKLHKNASLQFCIIFG